MILCTVNVSYTEGKILILYWFVFLSRSLHASRASALWYCWILCYNGHRSRMVRLNFTFWTCRRSFHEPTHLTHLYCNRHYILGSIGLTGTNARPSIAPTFGVDPMLGTNPITFGIPSSDPFPFVIDCATSVNQRGKLEKYARDGMDTPRGAVIDHMGVERTDTEGILRDMELGLCALNPLGGAGDTMGGYKGISMHRQLPITPCIWWFLFLTHSLSWILFVVTLTLQYYSGYGWAAAVELLCTALQSGPFGEDICGIDRDTGKPKPMPLGHFFLAIDIEKLCPVETFKMNAGDLLRALRESKKDPTGPGRWDWCCYAWYNRWSFATKPSLLIEFHFILFTQL